MTEQRWCGITAKMGTVLSGAFTIISTSMYLIFEENHMQAGNCHEFKLQDKSAKLIKQHIMCSSFRIVHFFSFITYVVSFFFLYSVYTQKFKGIVIYVIWIVVYEDINMAMQILTNTNSSGTEMVRMLRWFGLVSRVLMHCYWMYFVITYAYLICASQTPGPVTLPFRRISIGSKIFIGQKSKIINLSRHHKQQRY